MGVGPSFRWRCDYWYSQIPKSFFHYAYRCAGARLGLSEHPDENQNVFGFRLTTEDNYVIEQILERSDGRSLITTIGDCGAEYR